VSETPLLEERVRAQNAKRSRVLDQILDSLREHAALTALVGAYAAFAVLLWLLHGHEVLQPIGLDTLKIWATYTTIALSFPIAYHLVRFHLAYFRDRGREGAKDCGTLVECWESYRTRYFTVHRISGVIVACALLSVLMTTFIAYKRAIPLFNPFTWDPTFMRADRAVHMGRDPWRLLQPVFGSVTATAILDWLYVLWLRIIPVIIAWQVWHRDRGLRSQFLLTYAASSILMGTVMATWLSSAGPCYYGEIVGQPDPFAPLMSFLRDVNASYELTALRSQDFLWQGYIGAGDTTFYGISAMPSLHVAFPVLYVLAGFRENRWLGWAFLVYLIAILIGSVHLGWHYAIDGYVSILVVALLWALIGWAVRSRGSISSLHYPAHDPFDETEV
jgi:hypothetical protein